MAIENWRDMKIAWAEGCRTGHVSPHGYIVLLVSVFPFTEK